MLFFIISLIRTVYSQTHSLENCETIDPRYSDYCLNCNPGYIRNELYGCVEASDLRINLRSLIENCQYYSDHFYCKKCIEGYNVYEGRCQPMCESNCQCFVPNKCTIAHGRKLTCADNNSKCQSCCPDDNEQCCKCYDGFGFDSYYQCFSCSDPSCELCSANYTQCEKCLYDKSDSNGNCCSVNNCQDCNSNVKSCTFCASDYTNYDGHCCPEHSSSCYYDSSCSECESDYNCYEGYCIKCPSNCDWCTGSTCFSCKTGYILDGDGGCDSISSSTSKVLAMAIAIPIVLFFSIFGFTFGLTWYCRRRAMKKNMKLMKIAPPINPMINPGITDFSEHIIQSQQNNYSIVPQSAPLSQNSALGPTEITASTFLALVPNVAVDQNLMYNGIYQCKICSQAFQLGGDARVLPCGHAYHGNCIYKLMIIQNKKNCLHCGRTYA